MASFNDAEGRTWHLDLDLTTADEIKKTHGVDLIDPETFRETFLRLATGGTRLLVCVCYQLCHPQAEKAGVSPEEFGRAMKPKAVADAYVALKEAIADFFQLNPAAAEAIRRVWAAAERVAREVGETQLTRLDERLTSASRAILSGASAGSTPESPASTPAASPSASSTGPSSPSGATPGSEPLLSRAPCTRPGSSPSGWTRGS